MLDRTYRIVPMIDPLGNIANIEIATLSALEDIFWIHKKALPRLFVS